MHSGSNSCFENHLRASEPLSFKAWSTSRSIGAGSLKSSYGSSSGNHSVSDSSSFSSISSTGSEVIGSLNVDERERSVEAKERACC
ncbi:hypothetical protein SDJN03_14811, partial [Cucurbita argyrosperma subsp. sororia]